MRASTLGRRRKSASDGNCAFTSAFVSATSLLGIEKVGNIIDNGQRRDLFETSMKDLAEATETASSCRDTKICLKRDTVTFLRANLCQYMRTDAFVSHVASNEVFVQELLAKRLWSARGSPTREYYKNLTMLEKNGEFRSPVNEVILRTFSVLFSNLFIRCFPYDGTDVVLMAAFAELNGYLNGNNIDLQDLDPALQSETVTLLCSTNSNGAQHYDFVLASSVRSEEQVCKDVIKAR